MSSRSWNKDTTVLAAASVPNALFLAAIRRAQPSLQIAFQDLLTQGAGVFRGRESPVVLFRWSSDSELRSCSAAACSLTREESLSAEEDCELIHSQITRDIAELPNIVGIFDDAPIIPWRKHLSGRKLRFTDFPLSEDLLGTLQRRFIEGSRADWLVYRLLHEAVAAQSGLPAPAAEELQDVLTGLPAWSSPPQYALYLAHLIPLLAAGRSLNEDPSVDVWRREHQALEAEKAQVTKDLKRAARAAQQLGDEIVQVDCRSISYSWKVPCAIRDLEFSTRVCHVLNEQQSPPRYGVLLHSDYALILGCREGDFAFTDAIRSTCAEIAARPVQFGSFAYIGVPIDLLDAAIVALRPAKTGG